MNNGHRPASRLPDLVSVVQHFQYFAVFYFALLCAIFTVVVYYPGYMSPDSVAQLGSARTGVVDNVMPPLMSYIWAVTDKVLPGPAGMLILNNAIFWFSLASISFLVLARTVWRLAFVSFAGFWPPTYGSIGTIWKDVGMQVFLLAALAAILFARRRRRIWPLFVSSIFMFVAAGYRHNGVAAVVPMMALVILELKTLLPERLRRLDAALRKHALGLAFYVGVYVVWLGIIMQALTFVYTFRVSDAKLWSGALIFDLVGISVQQNTNYLPPYYDPDGQLTVSDLKGIYSPLHANSMIDPGSRKMLGIANPSEKSIRMIALTPAQAQDLQMRWFTVVVDNFGSYLHNRLITAGKLLVVEEHQPWYPYVTGIDANPFGLKFQPSLLNSEVMKIIQMSAFSTPIYSAWFYYVIVALCMFASFFWDFAYAHAIQLLAASVFFYLLSIFMFGMSGDFRYNVWALTCAYLCPVLLCAGRVAPRPDDGASKTALLD